MRIDPRHLTLSTFLGLSLLLTSSCGGGEDDVETTAPSSGDPPTLSIPDPENPYTSVEFVEDESETVADHLLELADALRRRRFEDLEDWFGAKFVGHSLAGIPIREDVALPAGVHRDIAAVEEAPIVDRAGFIASLRELLGPWTRVDSVLWKVKAADFERGRPRWGKLTLALHFLGRDADNGVISVHGKATARVTLERGAYRIDRLELTKLETDGRSAPMFVDVAAATGLAHTWARFGTEDNDSFHWNGAASADIDGDGDWDLFVPSDGRNFLYVAQPDGTWSEEAEARGVAQPDAGTGAVFFDCDRDGDQDLLVGQVSWRTGDGRVSGEALQLYLNDGEGGFRQTVVPGLDGPLVAYTLTVFDADGDGWLDVHVCGYGRVEAEHNNSWTEATNGSANALLRSLGTDKLDTFLGFEDVAEAAGIKDTRWSYAAAAADIDEDGDIDLYVANDYGSNRLWLNNGDGTFDDRAPDMGLADTGNGMGTSLGDLSGDGLIDVYVSNMSSTAGNRILGRLGDDLNDETMALLKKLAAGNSIFLRRGDRKGFDRLPRERGGIGASWAWTAALADLDLDGDLDVFCTNGFVTGKLAFDT